MKARKVLKITLCAGILSAFIMGMSISSSANVMYGDVDSNEKVEAADALAILKHAAKVETLDEAVLVVADVTGDTKVDAKDALDILKYVAKIIPSFAAEDMEPSTAPSERPKITPLPQQSALPTVEPLVDPTLVPLPYVSADPSKAVEGTDVTLKNLNGAEEADGIYTFTEKNKADSIGIEFNNPFAGNTDVVQTLAQALEGQKNELTEEQKTEYDPTATYPRPKWTKGVSLSFWAKYDWTNAPFSCNYPILVMHDSTGSKPFALMISLSGTARYEASEPNNTFMALNMFAGMKDEWNYYTITFANDWITVYLNGQECAYTSLSFSKVVTSAFNGGFMTRYNPVGPLTQEEIDSDPRLYLKSTSSNIENTLIDNRTYEGAGTGNSEPLLINNMVSSQAKMYLGGVYTKKVNSISKGSAKYCLDNGTMATELKAYFSELTAEQVAANYAKAAAEFKPGK